MKGNLYVLVFSVAMGAVCALLMAGATQLAAPRWEANKEAEKVRNVLAVLEVPLKPKASAQELLDVSKANVRLESRGALQTYVYLDPDGSGKARAVAVPFVGPGVWGPIKGFLATDPEMQTIRGVTFYEQEETPGLGAEIAGERFRAQFRDKPIAFEGKPGLRIIRGGGAKAPNEIDGISGATMTCDKVQEMLTAVMGQMVKERDNRAR